MKKMARRFTKLYLIAVVFFTFIQVVYGQRQKLIYYCNESNTNIFIFDFSNNRYCFSKIKDVITGSPKYSHGDFINKGDTVIVKSDYDNYNLPFDVQINAKKPLAGTNFNFEIVRKNTNPINDKAYEIERNRFLCLIINDNDTLKLDKDSIVYLNNVAKFYIASINAEIHHVYFKTQTYYNVSNGNSFDIQFNLNLQYAFYKYFCDTIVIQGQVAIWQNGNGMSFMNLRKTTFKKVRKLRNKFICEILKSEEEL